MDYAVHNVPSYQNMMGKENKAHMGSQSHLGSSGATEHDPGGYTAGKVGPSHKGSMMDSAHGMERGAPKGMEM